MDSINTNITAVIYYKTKADVIVSTQFTEFSNRFYFPAVEFTDREKCILSEIDSEIEFS